MSVNGATKQMWNGLRRMYSARQNARRFHRAEIGDVDPNFCFGDWLYCVGRATNEREENAKEKYRCQKKLADVYECEPAAVVNAREPLGYRDTSRMTPEQKAAMSATGDGTIGGYLVPPTFTADLIVDIAEEAIVRPEATVVPMKSNTMNVPVVDATTVQTAGTSPLFGGLLMSWVAENVTRPETEPTVRQIELKAWELTGYLKVSNDLMQDAVGLDAWLRRLIARSVAWYEDYAFLQGNGVGKPMGFIVAPATISVTRSAATTVKYVDFAAMDADLLPSSFVNAAWYFSVSTMVQITQLIDASGKTAWVPNYPPQYASEATGRPSIGAVFGRPAYVTEKLPLLGLKGDVILADPTLYIIGDRLAIEIAVSSEASSATFLAYQSAWRLVHRVDGQPWVSKSVTMQDGSTITSPYILLNSNPAT